MRPILNVLLTLAVLLAASGTVAARPCPKCDPGSGDNWWSTANVGAVGNDTGPVHHGLDSGAVENAGVGLAHGNDHKGFWAFLNICFEAWADKVSKMTGLDLHLKGNANVYADGHVVDAKANVLGVDTTRVVAVNDTTWKADNQVRTTLAAHGVVVPEVPGAPTESLPTLHGDACVDARVTLPCV